MLIKGAARLVFLSRHKVLGKDKVILKMASGVWQARMGGARAAGYLAGTAAHIYSILYCILYICTIIGTPTYINTETVFKEKLGVRELTMTSPYADSRVDSDTFTMGNPMPESTLILSQS
jgi:hypothetical protein